jgi:hypothetical protein
MPVFSSPKEGMCSDTERGNPVSARIRHHCATWCSSPAQSEILNTVLKKSGLNFSWLVESGN